MSTVITGEPVELGTVVEFQNGGGYKATEFSESGIPVVRVSDFTDDSVDLSSCVYLPQESLPNYQRFLLQEDDVLVSTVGSWPTSPTSPVGKVVSVPKEVENCLLNQNAVRLREIKGRTIQRYIRYLAQSDGFQNHIAVNARGSANHARISIGVLKTYRFPLPPLPTQQRIAEILGRLDDKIEANRRINRTLEQMAQALYKHWFVDFGPFQDGEFVESELGLIPKGWGVKALSSQVELLSGGTPSTRIEEYWNGEIDWVAASDVSSGQPFIMATERTITPLGVEKSSTKLLPAFTTIITARGTVGECGLLSREMAMNQTNYGVRGRDSLGEFTTYLLIDNVVENLRKHAYGTVFDTITRKTFDGVQVIVPPSNVLSDFEGKVKGFFHLMLNNQMQERKLAAIRDYLLPRLLSGGLAV